MIKLRNLLQEKKGDGYEYGCVLLNLNVPHQLIHSKISKRDLYEEEGDRTYGIEDEPHVTLLYGLHCDKINDEDVKKVISQFEFPEIVLHNVSLFKKDEYDVLKFDVFDETKTLVKCNTALKEFPFTNDYPNYHPHCTIAYLKSGLGNKYVNIFKGLKFAVEPQNCIYSKPGDEKIKL